MALPSLGCEQAPGETRARLSVPAWEVGTHRFPPLSLLLGHRHFFTQVDVLDGVEEFHSFSHGPLEGLAPGNVIFLGNLSPRLNKRLSLIKRRHP